MDTTPHPVMKKKNTDESNDAISSRLKHKKGVKGEFKKEPDVVSLIEDTDPDEDEEDEEEEEEEESEEEEDDNDVDEEELDEEDEGNEMMDVSELLQSFLSNEAGENIVEVMDKVVHELHSLNKVLVKLLKSKV